MPEIILHVIADPDDVREMIEENLYKRFPQFDGPSRVAVALQEALERENV